MSARCLPVVPRLGLPFDQALACAINEGSGGTLENLAMTDPHAAEVFRADVSRFLARAEADRVAWNEGKADQRAALYAEWRWRLQRITNAAFERHLRAVLRPTGAKAAIRQHRALSADHPPRESRPPSRVVVGAFDGRRRGHAARSPLASRGDSQSSDAAEGGEGEPPANPGARLGALPELIAPAVLARKLGVSRSLPYAWAKLGLVEAVEIPTGGSRPVVRLTRASVEAFVATFTFRRHRVTSRRPGTPSTNNAPATGASGARAGGLDRALTAADPSAVYAR